MTVRVLIADDQTLVRAGFRMIVDARDDLEVVGDAADGAEAVRLAETLRPDVVLMDIRMPIMDGIDATRMLAGPDAVNPLRVLILTTFDPDEYVYEALRAGASGFLLKDTPPAQLVEAIRVVAAGDALLAPSVTRRLIERFAATRAPSTVPEQVAREDGVAAPASFSDLTAGETEVLRLIARGLSNVQIGEALFIGESTVKTHVGRLLMKLGLRDRVQAVVTAYESGFVRPGDGT
jgi:DNA-binding NarL/FixJ family response regulator